MSKPAVATTIEARSLEQYRDKLRKLKAEAEAMSEESFEDIQEQIELDEQQDFKRMRVSFFYLATLALILCSVIAAAYLRASNLDRREVQQESKQEKEKHSQNEAFNGARLHGLGSDFCADKEGRWLVLRSISTTTT